MPWKQRGNRRYYYRNERQGRRVLSTYVGAGQLADLVAELDVLDRERREQEATERQIERSQFAELASTSEELTALLSEAQKAVYDALIAAGFHQHRAANGGKNAMSRKKPAPIIGPETPEQSAKRIIGAMVENGAPLAAREEFRALLDRAPDIALLHGDLPTLVRNHAAGAFESFPLMEESVKGRMRQIRKELLGTEPTPLETLLVEAVVLCYQDYFSFAMLAGKHTGKTLKELEQWERVLSSKEARYLRAIGELARVRRLLKLPLVQVNVALNGGQQVNVAGELPERQAF
jgi:hypothetical protein